MRPRDVKDVIQALYQTKRAVFLWGPPGVGKSQIVQQAADALGIDYLDVRLPYHPPEDLKFPIVDVAGKSIQFISPLFPKDPKWRGIIALEELPQSAPATQAVTMQVTLDRRCGDQPIPEGAMFVALGNRQQDRAGANRILTALANRFIHYDVDVSCEDWQAWALDHNISRSIRTFLAWKPGLLHQFKPEEGSREFPSPRSWEFASDALAAVPRHLLHDTISGCVGRGAAAEFVGYLDIEDAVERKYPLDKIFSDPLKAPVPPLSDGSIVWAICGAIAERTRPDGKAEKGDKKITQAATQYAMRLPLEFATYALRTILSLSKHSMAVLSAPGAGDFISKNKGIMLKDFGGAA